MPARRKPLGRRLSLVLVGLLLLVFMGVMQRENMQIEWFFFSLLAGLGGAALTHYLIAKAFGPLLIGRLWCGWACWTVMALDLLPFRETPGRLPARWGWLRYAHFAASLGLVLVLWFAFEYREPTSSGSAAGLNWMLVLSTECSLCLTCTTVCPNDALEVTLALALGGKELLHERPASGEPVVPIAL